MEPEKYVSCIRICGKPIPPPIMTPRKEKEMQELKRLAMQAEKIISQRRTQQTISKLQNILEKLENDKVCHNNMNYSKSDSSVNRIDSHILMQGQDQDSDISQDYPDTVDLISFEESPDYETSPRNTDDNLPTCVDFSRPKVTGESVQVTEQNSDADRNSSLSINELNQKMSISDENSFILTQPICHSTGLRETNAKISKFSTPPKHQRLAFSSVDQVDRTNSSMMTESSTLFTESTDIQPYMKVDMSDDTFSNSDVNFAMQKDFSSQFPGYDRNNSHPMSNIHEITPLSLNSISSSSPSTVESSPTVCEVSHKSEHEDNTHVPKLVRSGSYTLETPSPALLLALKQSKRQFSESDSVSVEFLNENDGSSDNALKGIKSKDTYNEENNLNLHNGMRSVQTTNTATTSPRKDLFDAQTETDEVFDQKQQHLQRYLDQLSLSNQHENDVSYFPSIYETGTPNKGSVGEKKTNIPHIFPKINVSSESNEEKNTSGINDNVSKNSLPEYDLHSCYQESLNSLSLRSNLSIQEKLVEQEKLFKEFCEALQNKQKSQMDDLMKCQWNEQMLLREQFLHHQEKNIYEICSTNNSPTDRTDLSMEESTQVEVDSIQAEDTILIVFYHFSIKIKNPEVKKKFDKLSALVKGHLTRKLMKTDQVQNQIQTIKDTLKFALEFQSETPIKNNMISAEDVALHRRLISQVTDACYQLHNLFFDLSKFEQIQLIVNSDNNKNKSFSNSLSFSPNQRRKLSSATVKYRARKNSQNSLKPSSINVPHKRNLNYSKSYHSKPQKNMSRKSSESVRRRLYETVNKENTKPSQNFAAKKAAESRMHWR
ncbi:Centriolar coiled-coil protein [Nymphon striatum]|nr:Centriolar coiled-coil protein [Nymphon striatum]